MTRRALLVSGISAPVIASAGPAHRQTVIIQAPSNLGLRPLHPGHVPGAWRAPAALEAQGLHKALNVRNVERLSRPVYSSEVEAGTGLRNGHAIRRFSEALAGKVGYALSTGAFPLVVGGDCSVLLGCLLGARRRGPFGLVHVDAHSDFFHPGNYDAASRPGSVAGMDLALATGRGEPLLAVWDGARLVDDAHVVQIGERNELDADYAFSDILQTRIRRLPVRQVLRDGVPAAVTRALAPVDGAARPLWLHLDLDVLDQYVMPAVDSPGSPGLNYDQLARLIRGLLASGRIIGADLTIYDPDLDPRGIYAEGMVACLKQAFHMPLGR